MLGEESETGMTNSDLPRRLVALNNERGAEPPSFPGPLSADSDREDVAFGAVRPLSTIFPDSVGGGTDDDDDNDDDLAALTREDPGAARGVLEGDPAIGTMVDVTSLLILHATAVAPKTVRDLAVELNLPIASLYRRVRALQSAGVLGAHKRKDRATGKETMVYEGLVSRLNIRFAAPDPVVELAFRNDENQR